MAMLQFEQMQPVGHSAAVVALILTWADRLGPLLTTAATIASLVWFLICIWQSDTCKGWRSGVRHWKNNLIMKHRAKVLAKLRARELRVQAAMDADALERAASHDARDLKAEAAAKASKLLAHAPVDAAEKLQ